MSRCRWRAWPAAAVIVVGCLIQASPAMADQSVPRFTIGLEKAFDPDLPDLLTARLSDPDGSPIGSATVEFWVGVEVMGDRFAFIGSAVTDATGVARLPFIPHQDQYDVRATFDGDDVWGSAEGIATIAFDAARVVRYEPSRLTQLGSLRSVMPRLMGVIVGLIWLALLALAFFTLRSFIRQGRQGAA